MEIDSIVIMCAGRGARLGSFTDDKPKCMVEINDKPIIRHIYEAIREVEPHIYIHIICGYKAQALIKYCYENGISAHFIEQNTLNGTAGAIELAGQFITNNFVVLSGDILYKPQDIKQLMKKPNSLLYTETNERLYEYGTLEVKEKLWFKNILIGHINEKSTEPTSNLVNCGAYHFNKNVFDYIKKTKIDKRFNEKIITNTINMMIDDGTYFGGIYIDRLNEISHPEDIKKVEKYL